MPYFRVLSRRFIGILLCALPTVLMAQQNGRFAEIKAQALDAYEKGKYAEVAGKLEEIWEQDQADPKVAEYLAIGYLYGERDPLKAEPLMEKAIDLGGQATFLVVHSHERLAVVQGGAINEFCSGRVSVSHGKFVFVADSGEHSTTITSADLRDISVAKDESGRVRIRAGGKTYVFQGRTHTANEAALFGGIAGLNLKR